MFVKYVDNLIKAQKALIVKYENLKQSINVEDTYAEKFSAINQENLNLKEQVAKLELDVYHLTKELEKRNAIISSIKNS